jgi:hypothetical protein
MVATDRGSMDYIQIALSARSALGIAARAAFAGDLAITQFSRFHQAAFVVVRQRRRSRGWERDVAGTNFHAAPQLSSFQRRKLAIR